MRLKFLSLIAVLTLCGTTVFADSSASILVNVVPENPAPNETVSIDVSSYASNLDSVFISWSVDGRSVSSGIGKKSFTLSAPDAGSENIVTARIQLPDGALEKRIVIRPNVMVLLWQANDSYVPPFYRGKALPTIDSEIKIVALPEVRTPAGQVNPKNMTYTWKKDYTNMAQDSGYGKNSFFYTNDYLENSNTVGVTATTLDQNYSSEASMDVGTTDPKIVFYKKDSGLGIIWEEVLADSHRVNGSEIIVAIPYFISPKQLLDPSLVWNWFINDTFIPISSFRKNILPLQTQSGVSGTSKIRLEIENKDRIFQNTSREINVEI